MSEQSICGIEKVWFQDTKTPGTKALVIEDQRGNLSGFVLDQNSLKVLLTQLLGLAGHQSQNENLQLEKLTGEQSGLRANHVSISTIRSETTVALTVYLGQMPLSFLVPVDSVMNSFKDLLPHIDMQSTESFKPN